jgi:hypothetical protein
MKEYFVQKNGNKLGPIKLEDLSEVGITPSTLVWVHGLNNWTEAKNVSELKKILEITPPPIEDVNKNQDSPEGTQKKIEKNKGNRPELEELQTGSKKDTRFHYLGKTAQEYTDAPTWLRVLVKVLDFAFLIGAFILFMIAADEELIGPELAIVVFVLILLSFIAIEYLYGGSIFKLLFRIRGISIETGYGARLSVWKVLARYLALVVFLIVLQMAKSIFSGGPLWFILPFIWLFIIAKFLKKYDSLFDQKVIKLPD